jgi:hypothetical protein
MLRALIAGVVALALVIPSQAQIVPNPRGCPPVAFCGCGTALWIFGAPIRALWLAANWMRFPAAKPAPGMIAVRRDRHHVLAIIRIQGKQALIYNPNSGHHLTRIHWVRLSYLKAHYSIRNPRGHA